MSLRLAAIAIVGIIGAAFSVLSVQSQITQDKATSTATVDTVSLTRTAISLTREPSLATPSTPNAIELTATDALAGLTHTPMATLNPETIPLTATEVIVRATQYILDLTRYPDLELTPGSLRIVGTCTIPPLAWSIRTNLRIEVEMALEEARVIGLNDMVHIRTDGISEDCVTMYPLSTTFAIWIFVNDLSDDVQIADLTASILSVLINYPPQASYGTQSARLVLIFRDQPYIDIPQVHRLIDTGYANALAAYEEGLRDGELLVALGGLLSLN